MKTTWGRFFRRIAATCAMGAAGSLAWSSAMCYAQTAFDSATDPVYNVGWSAGQNAGTGFGPWNFDGSGASAVHEIVPTGGGEPNGNQLDRAWGLGSTMGTEVSRAGRTITGGLNAGQTISTTIDTFSDPGFSGVFIVRLNAGGESICYGGVGCTTGGAVSERLAVFQFDFGDIDIEIGDGDGDDNTGLDLTESDEGMRIDITINPGDMYDVTLTPFDGSPAFSQSGPLKAGGPIDYIEFLNFSNNVTNRSEFFISEISIVPEPSSAALLVGAGLGALSLVGRRRKEA